MERRVNQGSDCAVFSQYGCLQPGYREVLVLLAGLGSLSPAVVPHSSSNKQRNLLWPTWYLNADKVMLTATEISLCVYNGTAQWGSFDDIPKNSHIS